MSDTSTAGGLNNEGLQITVTDRAIDASQAIHHNRLFPPVLEQLGITDWKLKLRPSREADKMAELQRFHQRVMTMKEMVSAGFDATMHEDMDGEIRFEFSGEASRQEYQPFGGFDQGQGQDRNQRPQDQESPEKPEPDNRLGEKNCPPGMISTPDNPKCHPIEEESKTKSETPLEEMTYDECVIKMKQEEDVMDPQALCGWIQKNLPGRIIKESKRELQQQTDKIETAFLRNLNKLLDKELLSELGKLKGASQKVINKKVDELIRKLKPNMEKGAFAEVIMAYQKGKSQAKQVLEKANMPSHINIKDFFISKPDEQVLRAIYEENPFWSSFANMSQSISDKLKENITESFKDPDKFTLGNLIKLMKQTLNTEVYRLERIARSETTAITAKGREIAFNEADPEDKNRYTWAGPRDSRTSDQCTEIERRVNYIGQGQGVSLKQLKAIMQDVVDEFNATQKSNWQYRDWLPHGNCRRRLQWVGRVE